MTNIYRIRLSVHDINGFKVGAFWASKEQVTFFGTEEVFYKYLNFKTRANLPHPKKLDEWGYNKLISLFWQFHV